MNNDTNRQKNEDFLNDLSQNSSNLSQNGIKKGINGAKKLNNHISNKKNPNYAPNSSNANKGSGINNKKPQNNNNNLKSGINKLKNNAKNQSGLNKNQSNLNNRSKHNATGRNKRGLNGLNNKSGINGNKNLKNKNTGKNLAKNGANKVAGQVKKGVKRAKKSVAKKVGAVVGAKAGIIIVGIISFMSVFTIFTVNEIESDANGGALTGNQRIVYNYLKNKGVPDISIFAIMGNWAWESGSFELNTSTSEKKNPDIENGTGGYGLAQWTAGRRVQLCNYVKAKTGDIKNWTDINIQLDFFWLEYADNIDREGLANNQWSKGSSQAEFEKITDLNEATEYFCNNHERPNKLFAHIEDRQKHARNYQILAGQKGDGYVSWALDIASDDSHGYCQHQAHRTGTPDYDCSSLIYYALRNTGIISANEGVFSTSGERDVLKRNGFVEYKYSEVKNNLVEGDIMWVKGHTEIYVGGGQFVGSHLDASGTIYCNAGNGDQNGKEISVGANNQSWTYVYRLEN